MTLKDRGPRPRVEPRVRLLDDLRRSFTWRSDRTDSGQFADPTGWWADASLLSRLGPALGELFPEARPTVVLGLQSRGVLLGALTAVHLGLGLVEVRKDPTPSTDSDQWLTTRTPPDYRDRALLVGFRRSHVGPGDRVLLVDDWIQTGGQALGVRTLVDRAGATWCGAALLVDGLSDPRLRHELDVRSLLRVHDL
jgi:adenine phosphoribosyltransferase